MKRERGVRRVRKREKECNGFILYTTTLISCLFLLLLGLDPQCPLEHIDQFRYFNLETLEPYGPQPSYYSLRLTQDVNGINKQTNKQLNVVVKYKGTKSLYKDRKSPLDRFTSTSKIYSIQSYLLFTLLRSTALLRGYEYPVP